MDISLKTLTSILEQHKLTDAQSEELQKVIFGLDDGRIISSSDVPSDTSVGETTKIEISYFLHTVFIKEGKVLFESHEYFDNFSSVEVAFKSAVQDEKRYSDFFNRDTPKGFVKLTDRELLAYPRDKYDEQRTHIWIEEFPSLVKVAEGEDSLDNLGFPRENSSTANTDGE